LQIVRLFHWGTVRGKKNTAKYVSIYKSLIVQELTVAEKNGPGKNGLARPILDEKNCPAGPFLVD